VRPLGKSAGFIYVFFRDKSLPTSPIQIADEQSSASPLTAHRVVTGRRVKPTPPIRRLTASQKMPSGHFRQPPAVSGHMTSFSWYNIFGVLNEI